MLPRLVQKSKSVSRDHLEILFSVQKDNNTGVVLIFNGHGSYGIVIQSYRALMLLLNVTG